MTEIRSAEDKMFIFTFQQEVEIVFPGCHVPKDLKLKDKRAQRCIKGMRRLGGICVMK